MMETILQLSRRMAHNASPSSLDMKYSPTDSLKLSSRDNKRIERRKPNWTEAENVFLLDQFGLHREILTCKATDASTNLKKQEIWRVICQNLNTHNTLVRRTPAEVRRKWKNLVTAAKKEVWEMRHQIHLTGGTGPNGRKISELSQRVLQLHSSGGFSGGNPNGLYGTLLSAGLLGGNMNSSPGEKYSKYGDEDKSFIPAHFTPIITLSESNNNHISLMGSGHSGEGPPSPLSEDDDDESSDSRNATEFMSDSGIYEQEGIDLRVKNPPNISNAIVNLSNSSERLNKLIKASMNSNSNNNSPHEEEDDDHDNLNDHDEEDGEDMSVIRYNHHALNKRLPLPISYGAYHHSNNHNHLSNSRLSNHVLSSNINHSNSNSHHGNRFLHNHDEPESGDQKSSETTEEIVNPAAVNGDLIDATLKLRNHFIQSLKESDLLTNLYKERLELQIDVLKLRKQKLTYELKNRPRGAAINRLIANNFSRVRLAKRRSFFRLRPRGGIIKDLTSKGTNTEVMVNGNSNSNSNGGLERESDQEEN